MKNTATRLLLASASLLLAAMPAQAERLSLGGLLEQIESLPPGMVSLTAIPGVVSQGTVENCVVGELITCDQMSIALIAVPPDSRAEVGYSNIDGTAAYANVVMNNVAHTGPVGRKIVGEIIFELAEYGWELRPESPVMNLRADTSYNGPLNPHAALISDGLVLFVNDAADVIRITTESIGVMVSAAVQPYAADAREAQIRIEITNFGELATNYIVTVPDCSANIEPGVLFQIVALEPDHGFQHEMIIDVKTDTAFAAGDTCVVRLEAPTGRLYDEVTVVFPDPS